MCDALISFLLNCLLLTRIEVKEAGALGAVRVVEVSGKRAVKRDVGFTGSTDF